MGVTAMPAAAAAAAVLVLTACGGSDERQEARRVQLESRSREAARVVEQLERATAERDFARICSELFSRAVRERAGGRRCTRTLRQTSGRVRRPRIRVRGIEFERGRAIVSVTTSATGQRPVEDSIVLERERGGYRIADLGGR
jgi:hypothetical protein